MKLSACFVFLAGLTSLAVASLGAEAAGAVGGLERRRVMAKISKNGKHSTTSKSGKKASSPPAKKAPAPAPAKKAPAPPPAKKPTSTPTKTTPSTKSTSTSAKPTTSKVASPLPVTTSTSSYSGPLSTIQQAQLAALTEYAQTTLINNGLAQFSDADFVAAGYKAIDRTRIQAFLGAYDLYMPPLRTFLGSKLPGNCTFKFPVGSVGDFVAMAKIMEQAGHNARFQTNVEPILTDSPQYAAVPRIAYQLNKGVLHNTIAQYIVSCPSSFDGGMVLVPPPVVAPVAGQSAQLGKSFKLSVPASAGVPANGGAWVHLTSGNQQTVVPVTPSNYANGVLTVTLPTQPKVATKGLIFTSIINNPDTGEYSGPSDTNLFTGSAPINAIGEVCQAPFAC